MKPLIIFTFVFILGTEAFSHSLTQLTTFQDPVRTSDNKRVDPNKNLDGSGGRYKRNHKTSTGKDFATRKRHVKTAKPNKDNGKEKQKSQPKGGETGA